MCVSWNEPEQSLELVNSPFPLFFGYGQETEFSSVSVSLNLSIVIVCLFIYSFPHKFYSEQSTKAALSEKEGCLLNITPLLVSKCCGNTSLEVCLP